MRGGVGGRGWGEGRERERKTYLCRMVWSKRGSEDHTRTFPAALIRGM